MKSMLLEEKLAIPFPDGSVNISDVTTLAMDYILE